MFSLAIGFFMSILNGTNVPCRQTRGLTICPFLNSFIPDAIGTVRVTPVTHIGTVNTKIIPIPTLNPGEKNFDRRIELLNQNLAREYQEA
jgi:hypothetical protein